MNTHRFPSTRQLRYFLALADTEHFGRAAAASHVSPSAFSAAIKELETVLGLSLVDRTQRRVTITRTGLEVAARARRAMDELAAMLRYAHGAGTPLSGPLHLGVIPTIAPFLLPEALPLLREQFPDLQLFLREDRTAQLHASLLDGQLDAILVARPYDLPGTECATLFRDRFLLAAREDSTLLDPESDRIDDLPADSILLLEDGHCLRDHALAACQVIDTDKVSRFAATSLLTLIEMVDADLGVTFVPEMAVGSAMLRNTGVRTRPLLDDESYREVALCWRRGSARAGEFKMLGEALYASRSGS
jgi:LysR family transcriptional regulator, hydrogen peroxide-inducible genes activator